MLITLAPSTEETWNTLKGKVWFYIHQQFKLSEIFFFPQKHKQSTYLLPDCVSGNQA